VRQAGSQEDELMWWPVGRVSAPIAGCPPNQAVFIVTLPRAPEDEKLPHGSRPPADVRFLRMKWSRQGPGRTPTNMKPLHRGLQQQDHLLPTQRQTLNCLFCSVFGRPVSLAEPRGFPAAQGQDFHSMLAAAYCEKSSISLPTARRTLFVIS
jgi:hypothetical protein